MKNFLIQIYINLKMVLSNNETTLQCANNINRLNRIYTKKGNSEK